MKKLTGVVLFLFSFLASFSQGFPNNQSISNPITLYHAKGGLTADVGFVNTRYSDTTAANLTYIAHQPGGQIIVGNTVYVRDATTVKWIEIGSSGTVIVGGDTTYVELPLYVDTTGGIRILKILHDDGLISGGIVTKSVADWDLDVTNAVYYLGHKAYSSSSSTVAIDTADATYDRIDRIAVDTTGSVIVITGTPSATPIAPQVNPSSQIALTTITVKAASTFAPVITKIIYDEGTEWDTATSGTIAAHFNNPDNPYHGAKDIYVPTYENGGSLEFTDSETDTASADMVLKMFLYSNIVFENSFQIQFFNGTDAVSNSISFNSGYGLNPNNVNNYQNISIPLTSFTFSSNIFNKLKITMAGEDISGAAGYYLDYIQLQKGIPQTGSGSCPLCIVDIHVTADSIYQVAIRQNGDTASIINWTGSGGSSVSPIENGLRSVGGIILVDSTLTFQSNIVWTINNVTYTRGTDTSFIIHTADSGYYRRDLIYADNTGTLNKLQGTPDTLIAITPALPTGAVNVTTVDVYGEQIVTPTANIIGTVPTLQQVTNEGNTTTNPIIINNNSAQASVQINGDFNRSYYWYEKNSNPGVWANTGIVLKNDVPDNPNNEHTGHFLQMYMGSTNSAFSTDGALIRTNGKGGLKVALDSGKLLVGTGSPSTGNYISRLEMDTLGALSFLNYKNNIAGDSVLSTDENGKVIMKLVTGGGITQSQLDDSTASAKAFSWNLKGNSGTTTANFIGTTDNQPLLFRTNNILAGYVSHISYNVSLGNNSLPYSTTVFADNSNVGYSGLRVNTTGTANSNLGAYGLFKNTTGNYNNNVGVSGLFNNTTGSFNTSFGNTSLYNNNGNYNAAFGDSALYNITTGNYNVGLGHKSGFGQTTASNTLYISDSTYHLHMKLDSAAGTAPSVIGKDENGYWHVYAAPSGGGGGTYTASNGLSLNGSDIQLGGVLTKNDSIILGSNELDIIGVNSSKISLTNFGLISSVPYGGDGAVKAINTDGIALLGQTTTGTPLVANRSDVSGIVRPILQLIGSTSTPLKGQGYSIKAYLPITGVGASGESANISFIVDKVQTSVSATSIHFKLRDSTNGSAIVADKVVFNNDGKITFNQYGSGTFTGTPVKQLSVTSTGDIIETSQPIITSGTTAPSSTPSKVGDIYVDITAKKLYFAAGTSSSSDWIITN